jgi:hypothetical protein
VSLLLPQRVLVIMFSVADSAVQNCWGPNLPDFEGVTVDVKAISVGAEDVPVDVPC